jgi:hypothetical protein
VNEAERELRLQILKQYQDALQAHVEDWPHLGDCEWNCTTVGPLCELIAKVRRDEREKCETDIQDAIGDWGGPQREYFTQAMHKCIGTIRLRANGLDQWGRPLQDE